MLGFLYTCYKLSLISPCTLPAKLYLFNEFSKINIYSWQSDQLIVTRACDGIVGIRVATGVLIESLYHIACISFIVTTKSELILTK